MSKHWKILNADPYLQTQMSDALGIHPIIAQLLINRDIIDINSARQFLQADLKGLGDPFQFKDMEKAVNRIKLAQKNKEKVLVFGDYDVDGVTSSALMHRTFVKMNIDVLNHIPHRVDDGYGLNHEIGDVVKEQKIKLLITVDCGITAVREVKALNELGIDVIIIDHHQPGKKLPEAFAIINPKQTDCPYPFKDFASVGLVAKFIHAIVGKLEKEILDLVAVGTIADIVPLRGENRIFVKAGLLRLPTTKNKGLSALMDIAKINRAKRISPYHIGFILGPRINAAGRMDTAYHSLELLLSDNKEEAHRIAKTLEKYNRTRQKLQRGIVQEAMELVEQEVNFKDQKVIVLSKEGWHKGVLGIVASRITDRYYRPSVVISLKDGIGTASARSIDGFHLHKALSNCASHLEEFGGHEGAAGLTIKEENIDSFKDLINQIAQETLQIKQLIPIVKIDCEIALSDIDMEFAEIIESMEPFGEGNPMPIFCSRKLSVKGRPQILGKDTLKFWVTNGKQSISAVGFGMAKFESLVKSGEPIDLAYEISIDDWNKAPTPQLKLKDIRISELSEK